MACLRLVLCLLLLLPSSLLSAAPSEAELEQWLESDDPLPPSASTADVNEGELVFLAEPPEKAVHHHRQWLVIDADSRVNGGWVAMRQCHDNLDRVPATQIVFRPGRVRDLAVTRAEGIGRAWVAGDTVQLEDVGQGARLCLRGRTRALTALPEGLFRLCNGPYMRRFLDGYYPLRVSVVIDYAGSGLEPVRISPPAQPGFTVIREPGRLRLDAWFEGRLKTRILFRAASP